MSDSTSAHIPKPQLRRLLASNFRKHAIGAVVFTTVVCGLFKHFIADARKKRYAEYYVDYDENKVFEEMRQKNVFYSFPADK